MQVVEFDVELTEEDGRGHGVVGILRDAEIPPDSKAAIIRGERATVPRGDEAIAPGDRVVIGFSDAARA